ncbi:MAG TPA: acyltransferase [Acidimicrobiales bacterium]|nr:acyltransferase [Acidimicrobiales bacterium]
METLRSDVREGVDRGTEARSLTYLSSLDGLRAIAVLAVVVYHAEPDRLSGGFLGVDVFFVVSGFLITSLLLREKRRDRRIDLRRFWRRRARRLGPAVLTVLSVVAVAGWLWTPSDQLGRLRGDGLASLAYVLNWRLIFQGDSYFDTFIDPSPLRHLWSLSIEEQFYLAWPLVVVLVLARSRRLLGPVALLVCTASVWAMGAIDGDLSRIYYGTGTRLHVIMAGCLLAVLADRRPKLVRGLAATPLVPLVATAAILAAMFVVTDDDANFYPRGLVLFSVVATLAVAGCARYGELPILSNRALVEIGKRSYGLYLWHWPVQVFLTDQRLGMGHAASTVVRVAVMGSATWLSYRFIEQPVRRSHAPLPRWWLALPLGVAVLYVITTLGATESEFTNARPGEVVTVSPEGPPEGGPAPRYDSVLIVGDSVSVSIERPLAESFAAVGLTTTVANHIGCGVGDGLAVTEEGDVPPFAEGCPDNLVRQDEIVAEVDPDVVFVFAHADSFPRRLADGTTLVPEDDPAALGRLVERAADRLTARGAIVAFALPADVRVRDDTRTNGRIGVYRDELTALAARRDDVVVVDVDAIVCPDHSCLDELDGVPLRPDGVHYSDDSAPLISPLLVAATMEALAE